MRILHLGYEDPSKPGSGGGSARTRQIVSRLGSRHEITVIVAAYPGARERIEGGAHWVPIGSRTGGKSDQMTYLALLGRELINRRYDLVVEDFGPPFSVGFSPLFTRKPVVASVQWIFAGEMRQKYGGLPFDIVERHGLRFYKDFIVLSEWVSTIVRRYQSAAQIEVIPSGIDEDAFTVQPTPPTYFLFVGRLDVTQKGGDLLLAAYARIIHELGDQAPPLLIVGDGPDETMMKDRARQLGITSQVEFRGRVDGIEKYRLMAGAHALLMPSRFETFGMVAVEAQAAGAPLVAFDVGPLSAVTGPASNRLVRPFDLEAFTLEAIALTIDGSLRERIRSEGRAWAQRYNWDAISERQEQHYLRALVGRV
jgi:glycosyltransferase involved in cell wall biosynthesis